MYTPVKFKVLTAGLIINQAELRIIFGPQGSNRRMEEINSEVLHNLKLCCSSSIIILAKSVNMKGEEHILFDT
jgi:hypothetical protein